MDNIIIRKAYAKINLGLDVVRRLPNGYHEVRMIMQNVDIYDVLTFAKAEEGILLQVDNQEVPADGNNLICKAAKLLLETAGIQGGVRITLEKNIPIAAGMAGGSTDAAAAFLGINELYEIGYDIEQLKALGVKIGADVPYCIQGGTALAEGIGEVLSELPAPPACHLLVAKPDINVSTKFVYENLRANELEYHPDIDGMIEALDSGDLKGITDRLGNVLETVTVPAYPIIQEIKDVMLAAGAENALMSGSGPTVFGIFTDKDQADAAAGAIRQAALAKQVFVTGFVNN
jgi:4-diphosphocytidyl-2-C-methyl-D-erythritol kinase